MNGWRHPRRCLGGFVAAIAVTTIIGPSPQAQAKRPMTLLDIAELPRIILPQLSPDGKTLIYLQSRADWKIGRPVWHLWRQDVGGAPAQLTTAPAGVIPFQPRWSPDPITHHATLPTAPTWSPHGSPVYFIAADPATAA